MTANGDHFAIKRNGMVIIVAYNSACTQQLRCSTFNWNSIQGAAFIEQKLFTIGHPVRCFKTGICFAYYFTASIFYVNNFKPAAKYIIHRRYYRMRIGSILMYNGLVYTHIPY